MKITVRDLSIAHAQLTAVGGLDGIPAPVQMRVSRAMRAVRQEAELADEVRQKTVRRFLKKDAAGKPVEPTVITDPEALDAEIRAFLKSEVEIDVQPVKLSELGSAKTTPAVLEAFHWLIIEG